VIECGWLPAVGGVTFRALNPKFAGVWIIPGMTGRAVGGRAFEDSIDMAALASDTGMFTSQLEG
jgi:hypothetical protein